MKRIIHTPFPLAVVLSGEDSPAGFDILRSLAIAGLRTVVASSRKNDIAFFSNACVERLALPPYAADNEDEIIEQLITFSNYCAGPPVLYYASDTDLSFVMRHRETLSRFFRFLLPQDQTLGHILSAAKIIELASLYRFPLPRSVVVHGVQELHALISSIEFPCIVKQDWGHGIQQGWVSEQCSRRISSPKELMDFCVGSLDHRTAFVVQSYVEGSEDARVSFHGYFDEHSCCLGGFIGETIRTSQTGEGTYIQTVHNPALAQSTINYLERIGFRGMATVEYKWDGRTEQFKMVGINPRFSPWHVAGAYAGMNLVHIAYLHLSGKEIIRQTQYKAGVRVLYMKKDVTSFLRSYRSTRRWTVTRYLQSWGGQKYYRVFDPEDSLPFIVSMLDSFSRNIRRILQLLFWKEAEDGTPSIPHNRKKQYDMRPLEESFHS